MPQFKGFFSLLWTSWYYLRTVSQSVASCLWEFCFASDIACPFAFPCSQCELARCEWIVRDVGQTAANLSRHTLHLVTREFGKQNVNTALPSPLTPAPHTPKPSSQPFKLLFNFVDCALNFVDCPVIWTLIVDIRILQSVWSSLCTYKPKHSIGPSMS